MELNKIYNENCLDTLRRMPDEFVDCVVTSPPYFGLRAYSAPDSIWGGNLDCSHDWQGFVRKGVSGGTEKSIGYQTNQIIADSQQGFCTCGAWKGQLGLEPTFQMYIDHLIEIFREIKRVLKKDGSVWVNLGDSYGTNSGNARSISNGKIKQYGEVDYQKETAPFIEKPKAMHKSLLNIPNRFAIQMTDELGFILRNELIWHKPACMPSSATDRFTVDFEKIFFFTKSQKYYFEQQSEPLKKSTIARYQSGWNGNQERGYVNGVQNHLSNYIGSEKSQNATERNMRTVWSIPFEPQSESHYASYPTRLIETPIKAGCREGGIVYEPFTGTGTTLVVAHKLGRNWIGSEISKEYCDIAEKRLEPYLAQSTLF